MKNKIVSHFNVDLDSVFGICIQSKLNNISLDNVKFVGANTDKVADDEIPVDIVAEKHGIVGKSYVSSHFPEKLSKNIIDEIDEQDSTGKSSARVPLASLIAGLRFNGMKDQEILKTMCPVVDGLMKYKELEDQADVQLKKSKIVKIGKYKFLRSIEGDVNPILGIKANEMGITGAIFQDKNNLGITRYPGNVEPNLATLKSKLGERIKEKGCSADEVNDWFAHKDGFLFSHGSRKAPASKKSCVFDDADDFEMWLDKNVD